MGLFVIQILRCSIKRSLHYDMLSIQNSNSMRKVPFILKNLRYLFLFLLSRWASQKSFFHKKLTNSIAHFCYNCTHRADGLILWPDLNMIWFIPGQFVQQKRCYIGKDEFQTGHQAKRYLKKSGHQELVCLLKQFGATVPW